MRTQRFGRILLALGFSGLGLLSLIFQDFALTFQPVPAWVPARAPLACLSGAILLVGGLGLLLPAVATRAALALTAFVASWQVLLHAPSALSHPGHVGSWLNFSENALLTSGCWILFLALARADGKPSWAAGCGATALRVAQVIFALSLPDIGAAHFVFVDITASMTPAWMPFRHGLAYLTGIGHVAAALGILLGILPRLAAALEAAMITLFVVFVHGGGVALEPGSRSQWTMFFAATAFAGAAWCVAGSFARKSPEEVTASVPA